MTPCPFCGCERTIVKVRDDEDVPFLGKVVLGKGMTDTHCLKCSYVFETHEQHDANIDILRAALKN